jgi:serine/threonine protein kinase
MTSPGPTVCPACAAIAADDGAICPNCGANLVASTENTELADLVADLTRALDGKYLIGRVLGTGRSGVTVEARHIATRRNVALKVAWNTTAARRQVLRETVLSTKVAHPSVMTMRDVAAPESMLVVEMPLAAGGTLADLLAQYGPVPFPNVLEILRAVAGALDQAHAVGIIHGGLQPSKILLDSEGRALVSDFSIRVPQRADWDVSRPSEAGATPYMPLEQRHDSPTMDGRVDQYALAIIAYELLRGRPTWRFTEDGGFEIDPIEIIVHRPLVSGAPTSAGTAIKRAIAKDPAFRFVSASEFVRTFSGAAAETVAAEQIHHPEPVKAAQRSRAWFLVPAVLAVAVVATRSDIRNAAVDILEGRWSFHKPGADSTAFGIDTTITDISLPVDSGKKGAKDTKKDSADSTKRHRRSGGDVTASTPSTLFDESVLIVTADGDKRPTVLVDGRARGQAPLTVKLSAGQHLVSLRGSTRYAPHSLTVIVAAGDTARASFKRDDEP